MAEIDTVRGLLDGEAIDLWGVADVGSDDKGVKRYNSWIARGWHGSMEYLRRHGPMKFDPKRLMPGARSVIVVALNYYQDRDNVAAPESSNAEVTARGAVARYAWGRDYHKELGRRLRRVAHALRERFPDDEFRPFVDATPLHEATLAGRAGIGFQGRNSMVITERYGSWVFLGEIVTTLALQTGIAESEQEQEPDRQRATACPAACRACIDGCPTGAISMPGIVDAGRCISYLTIEHDGAISPELMEAMGTRVFGCDRCQEVCPLNRGARQTTVDTFTVPIAGDSIDLDALLGMESRDAFVDRFAGSPVMRAGPGRMVRNALIAAANGGAANLRGSVRKLAHDSDPVIRETAAWALSKLAGSR